MNVAVHKKSGFVCYKSPLIIKDDRGLPFYEMQFHTPALYFNLPVGVYSCNQAIEQLPAPVSYSTPSLPKPNKKFKLPSKVKIKVGKNPNKCSVWLRNGGTMKILVDESIAALPRPEKVFIFYHELGHYFYSENGLISEANCDSFAQKMMLKRGYNPSQTWKVVHGTLNHYHIERRERTLNNLKKHIK